MQPQHSPFSILTPATPSLLPPPPRSFKNSLQLAQGVTIGHLQEAKDNPLAAIGNLFGGQMPDSKLAAAQADTFIIINATCIELLYIREYVNAVRRSTCQAALPGSSPKSPRADHAM